ncbi:hypothetical protein GPECTOR_10g927 [Gonium pectorale]|uniref:Flavin-containing monooxygenase n=1 Tax=Gonium pectorale TaxID=33097 RepID=A0A150GR38_GONPE|nr:hypothetical protein GPECTOR_10g927 [Gonium pectorale]|eukprot:KXZ52295.1 hypothetical protein GPECTOR_10g927 [Gonium pectorale]
MPPRAFPRSKQELYDAVVVCNGHYSEPRLPEVRGAFGSPPAFPGQQLHSHNYRDPEQWRGKVVLVMGASNSGEDVSRMLLSFVQSELAPALARLSATTGGLRTW